MVDSMERGFWTKLLRTIFSSLDRIVYMFLNLIFTVFFNIVGANFLEGNIAVNNLYSRIELLVGVFIVFKISFSLINGLIDPDRVTDKKNGFGNIIVRVMVMLAMLTLIVPLKGIPDSATVDNSYNKALKSSGILFGTLSTIQGRILNGNILGKLILGVADTSDGTSKNMSNIGSIMVSSIIKGFIRPNTYNDGSFACKKGEKFDDDDDVKKYSAETSYGGVLDYVNKGCDNDGDIFKFSYSWLISTLIGALFIYIMVGFCVNIAIRLIKLAILRIIAPIPIISYIDPKSEKGGAFGSWVKMYTTVYLDLFIRLSFIYLVVFIAQAMIEEGFTMFPSENLFINVISQIIIWVGLFMFAKDAPKFLMDALGIKGSGKSFFGGVGAITGAAALAGGAIGSFAAGRRSSIAADKANGYNKDDHNVLGRGLNHAKHLVSGIAGGASGISTGYKAATTAKDHAFKNTTQAMRDRNARALSQGYAGSTLGGRMKSTVSSMFNGESLGAAGVRNIQKLEAQKSALDAVKSRASGEMVKQTWTKGSLGIATDIYGNDMGDVNYKSFMAAKDAAASRGENEVNFQNADGEWRAISMQDANMQFGYLLKNNEDSYIQEVVKGNQSDASLSSLITDAEAKGSGIITGRDSVTKTSDALAIQITEAKRNNELNQTNDMFAGKK